MDVGFGARSRAAAAYSPDRIGKIAVIAVAWNHMPVLMWNDITQAREVDLVRRKHFAQHRLRGKHGVHQPGALGGSQIGHFAYVLLQDHAAEAGVGGLVSQHDAAEVIMPEHLLRRRIA